MATAIYENQEIWWDGYRLTTRVNTLGLDHGVETPDDTTFGDGTRSAKGGLINTAASLEGLYDADPYDAALFGDIGVDDGVLTFGNNGTAGALVYFFKTSGGSYEPIKGAVGDIAGFSLNAQGRSILARGTLMENQADVTSTADGTGRQIGAVSSTQKAYAALHVLKADGTTPTLDVVIESDASDAWSGSETTRITFSQANSISSQWQEVSGAITDTWWRPTWTLGGTSPDFDFVIVLAIQ